MSIKISPSNVKKEEYGYDQLLLSLEKNSDKTPQEISNTIIKEVYAFAGDEDLNDDYTLLILKFK